ncbi:dicarboxylate/amino acid:cation symporter [Caloramator sp. CAR-1]|uniref:dicarboxylate/amino acid:cation symporter n=2 Tax=unclassified Caloramator TaxID=2629145 RepID=UPI0026E36B90|nr:dicarboxylate/amino acid:cation symporter [Caloramator sp. CAR-1]MDO6355097.1 dicarboxylate/amino acid:cation symporter [Caloramator sp. CAR-1]
MSTVFALILTTISFSIIKFIKNKKVSFSLISLIALTLGLISGIVLKNEENVFSLIGQTYISLIKMLVLPLIITSIITSINKFSNTDDLKRIAIKAISILMLTTAIATFIGLLVGNILNVGAGYNFINVPEFKAREIPKFTQVFLDMIPKNPVNEMANGKIIPVIIFSILIAISLAIEGEKNMDSIKIVREFFIQLNRVISRLTKIVISLTPYGVYGLIASISTQYGIATLLPLIRFIIAVYVACLLQIAIVHTGIVAFVAKVNPLKFFKKIYPAQVVAFSTQSSFGTLPVTIKSLTEGVGISEKIANFVAPIGATAGMNACGGIYPALVAIFVANMFNKDLSINHYLILIATTTLSSIGIAGVPGTASLAATVVLASLGLPIEGLAMLLGVDVIVDMARTMTNVTGASVSALVVASSEKEIDLNILNS